MPTRLLIWTLLLWSGLSPAWAGVDDPPGRAPLADDARQFGTLPSIWGVQLSPDGKKISALQAHKSGLPIAIVVDLVTGKASLIAASDKDRFDLAWCRWASDERLLCSYRGVDRDAGHLFSATRLIGVDPDGSDLVVLLQRKLRNDFAQFQDRIVDWLPDEPDSVLVMVPDGAGSGVGKLDVRTGGLKKVVRSRTNARHWLTDGSGQLRVRLLQDDKGIEWQYRRSDDSRKWRTLAKYDYGARIDFDPVGFGEDRDRLLVFEPSKGRIALKSLDLTDDPTPELVYAHPEVDVSGGLRLGRHQRLVGVQYATDKVHTHYFDAAVEKIRDDIGGTLPDKAIDVLGESWDRRFYLVYVSSDRDPGTYYRFDVEKRELLKIMPAHPLLADRRLAHMKPLHHPSADGNRIPAYLTLPVRSDGKPLPAVILPHGGPESRDVWGFDWLPQFFAARGYAVLQSNFRGSGGFGVDWTGEGGFRAWRLVVSDLEHGAKWLIDEGIADPDRLCIVGWSYGGYAALMSAIEHPSRYRCVVSVAGVTDPRQLVNDYRPFIGSKAVDEYIGRNPDVLKHGSATNRAAEMTAPVLLLHGDEDLNVSIKHSRSLERALEREKKSVELVEFDDAEHGIWNSKHRIEMLERMGAFVDRHTKPRPAAGPTVD